MIFITLRELVTYKKSETAIKTRAKQPNKNRQTGTLIGELK